MKLSGIKFWAVALFVVASIQVAVVSCSDDPGVENYYTQSREYAADYLKNREQYSEYLKILERARVAPLDVQISLAVLWPSLLIV